DAGGHIVATGTPEDIASSEASYTGQYLRPYLARRAARRRRAGEESFASVAAAIDDGPVAARQSRALSPCRLRRARPQCRPRRARSFAPAPRKRVLPAWMESLVADARVAGEDAPWAAAPVEAPGGRPSE